MNRIPSLITSLVAVLVAGGALAMNLHAQSDVAITVRVPFAFTVGSERIAAGTYRFSQISPYLLSVADVKTGEKELFVVRPEQQAAAEQHGRLIFADSKGRDVLNEIHFPGADSFSELVDRRGAEQMEAKGSSTSRTVVVAQR